MVFNSTFCSWWLTILSQGWDDSHSSERTKGLEHGNINILNSSWSWSWNGSVHYWTKLKHINHHIWSWRLPNSHTGGWFCSAVSTMDASLRGRSASAQIGRFTSAAVADPQRLGNCRCLSIFLVGVYLAFVDTALTGLADHRMQNRIGCGIHSCTRQRNSPVAMWKPLQWGNSE